VVCAPSTLFQLQPVSDRRQGVNAQRFESLVYFSTFEPIDLTPESQTVSFSELEFPLPMLYDSVSNPCLPCLYICHVANVLGRAPLIPCSGFIGRNSYPTEGPLSYTASRTIGVLDTPPPTRSENGATAAGSAR
jgi:hypothetical protein